MAFDAVRSLEQLSPSIPSVRGPGTIYESVEFSEREVALTFDDGPHPLLTESLLDSLRSQGVKATFYVLGENVSRYPEIVERMVSEGHEVGNHTWSHRFLTTQNSRSILEELDSTHRIIQEVASAPPATLRPPFGAITRSLARWISGRFGYDTVLWSVDARDYGPAPSSPDIEERIVTNTKAGAIILAHDTIQETVRATPGAIDHLLDGGYQFVTVSELIRGGKQDPSNTR